jgi:tetratricopeptide (TPR) repeat protein
MIAPLVLAATLSAASAHRAVSTQIPQAQVYFDSGLTSFYAYDRIGAQRAFEKALQIDPHLAMAAWGEALAAAGDLNHALTPEAFAAAKAYVTQAVSLETSAPNEERALIDALALRYAGSWDDRETGEQRYVQAMETIAAQNPTDDDVATITAEALLEDREPPTRAIALLQPVLTRHPANVMANHLCIHAYEDTPDPAPGLPCADRLTAMTFLPQHEHLAHMPAHAYTENGKYAQAIAASERAWQLRQVWNQQNPRPYELEYAAHDAAVGYAAAMMLGDESAAHLWESRFAQETQAPLPLTTLARFEHWSQIIAQAQQNDAHKTFALGLAYAHTGDLAAAQQQLDMLRRDAPFTDFAEILSAAVEESRGDVNRAAASLQRAIQLQTLNYVAEYIPLFPAGEMLGELYIRAGRYADARQALEASLQRYPGDPRAQSALTLACSKLNAGACKLPSVRP